MYKNLIMCFALVCTFVGILVVLLGIILGVETQTGFPLIGLGLLLTVKYNELQMKEYLESKEFLQEQLEKVINNESNDSRETNRK
jgi:hypothetical protein